MEAAMAELFYICDPRYGTALVCRSDNRHFMVETLPPDGKVQEFLTLHKGPPIFATLVPTALNAEGWPTEGEWQWFETREAAEKAMDEALDTLPRPETSTRA
jgi:hypothetical protein